ncbi:unnamed protein product [Oreochromis niloticus]|nr:unnamed protein product [Mustela putorius furo]
MEGEIEEKGQSIESGITFTQAETVTQSCGKDSDESQSLQEPEEEDQADGGHYDGDGEPSQGADDQCSGAEALPDSTLVATDTQDDTGCLPSSSLQTEEELSPTPVLSYPPNTHNRPPEPCWYCLRSLDSEYRPETTKQQDDSDHLSPLPSSGQKVSYQTDPRPHFGVAWSSHSPCHPLWGSEGPCWGQRNQEVHYQTHTCPHCHLGLPPDTLRWHEAKCLLFEDLRKSNK